MQVRSISLILPATDETDSIRETVRCARDVLGGYELQFVIVTSPTLTSLACRSAIEAIRKDNEPDNEHAVETFDQTLPGVGGALREGFKRARGDVTVLMSSDLETDPSVLPLMIEKIAAGYDIAAASRWSARGGFSGYNPVKLVLNFLFQQFFRVVYSTRLSDLTYAYRAYRTPIVQTISWEELGFPFLFETLVKPLRLGYCIAEVAAPWRVRQEGRSHNSFKQTLDYVRVGVRVRFQSKKTMCYSARERVL